MFLPIFFTRIFITNWKTVHDCSLVTRSITSDHFQNLIITQTLLVRRVNYLLTLTNSNYFIQIIYPVFERNALLCESD